MGGAAVEDAGLKLESRENASPTACPIKKRVIESSYSSKICINRMLKANTQLKCMFSVKSVENKKDELECLLFEEHFREILGTC